MGCQKESKKYAECVYENVLELYLGQECYGDTCVTEACELECPEAKKGNCALCGSGLDALVVGITAAAFVCFLIMVASCINGMCRMCCKCCSPATRRPTTATPSS